MGALLLCGEVAAAAQVQLPEAFQTLITHITPYQRDISSTTKEQFVVGLNKFVRDLNTVCVRPLW